MPSEIADDGSFLISIGVPLPSKVKWHNNRDLGLSQFNHEALPGVGMTFPTASGMGDAGDAMGAAAVRNEIWGAQQDGRQ